MTNEVNTEYLIVSEAKRLTDKYKKDFFNYKDLMKVTGLGRDSVRKLFKSNKFPTTKVGSYYLVSVLNFARWMISENSEVRNG